MVAEQLAGQGIDREQAECLANGILDGIGTDRLAEIGASGGDLSALTPEEMGSMMSAIVDCGVSDPTGGESTHRPAPDRPPPARAVWPAARGVGTMRP